MDTKEQNALKELKDKASRIETQLQSCLKIKRRLPAILKHFPEIPEPDTGSGDRKMEMLLWVSTKDFDGLDEKTLFQLFKMCEQVSDSEYRVFDKKGKGDGHVVFYFEKGLTPHFSKMPILLNEWISSCEEKIAEARKKIRELQKASKKEHLNITL